MKEKFADYIERLAYKSLLYEVSASPKPGLVDQLDNGAHQDMDFKMFVKSANAIKKTFYDCAIAGANFDSNDYPVLLHQLRVIGIHGEEEMFAATKGVNTHKGLIFSLGIISAAAGTLYKAGEMKISSKEISKRVKEISSKLIRDDFKDIHSKSHLTYGERLYKEYGIKGIRGEVESGFESVMDNSLPYFEERMRKNESLNDALVNCLLILMTSTQDGNVMGRHNDAVLEFVKIQAQKAMQYNGISTAVGRKFVTEMNRDFIKKRISPGGSADLLAITIMLYMLESGEL
jgi:triphosphoribosyl-dephospho-CoA synthase